MSETTVERRVIITPPSMLSHCENSHHYLQAANFASTPAMMVMETIQTSNEGEQEREALKIELENYKKQEREIEKQIELLYQQKMELRKKTMPLEYKMSPKLERRVMLTSSDPWSFQRPARQTTRTNSLYSIHKLI